MRVRMLGGVVQWRLCRQRPRWNRATSVQQQGQRCLHSCPSKASLILGGWPWCRAPPSANEGFTGGSGKEGNVHLWVRSPDETLVGCENAHIPTLQSALVWQASPDAIPLHGCVNPVVCVCVCV